MKSHRSIELRGGAEHNLKKVDIDIPLHRLTVICGVSGSGKTSFALDTLFAEGQRRYIESFSAYTRQFLARVEKPKYDRLDHLPPSLSVSRSGRGRNNRSTVGTASEMLEPLRILFSLVAELKCYGCGASLQKQSVPSIERALQSVRGCRAMLGFDFEWKTKSDLAAQLAELQSSGFIRIVIGDQIQELSQDRKGLAKQIPARGRGVVIVERFRLTGTEVIESLRPSIELSMQHAFKNGVIFLESPPNSQGFPKGASLNLRNIQEVPYAEWNFSRELRCPECDIEYPECEPRLFSFNSPLGACSQCTGFGEVSSIDMDKIVPDRSLSLREGAIAAWRTPAYEHEMQELLALAPAYDLPVDLPVSQLTKEHWDRIQHGVPEHDFGGLDGFFAWLERKKYKMHVRAFLARWKSYTECPSCHGQRLSPASLAYRTQGLNFHELADLTVSQLQEWVTELEAETDRNSSSETILADSQKGIRVALQEVRSRLQYLDAVGLEYLTLSRTMHTLSGGEAQRVSLTTLLGSDLVDMLYVLDEPTVGLHPIDTEKVAQSVQRLVQRGNTVVLIEHEPYLLHQADHVLEIGPGAGIAGGTVCFSGKPQGFKKAKTLTAKYLFQEPIEREPRPLSDQWIELQGARGRNLKEVDLKIPIGSLCVVVGVSGSGKSSLILDTLVPALESRFQEGNGTEGLPYTSLRGTDRISGCESIDQSPIARSIRSTPATYTKVMDEIRTVFGSLQESRQAKLTDSHFSFNSATGRCPLCEGLGFTIVDMQFMADVQLLCSDCNGKRFKPEVLAIRYRDRNIADILDMSVEEAKGFFRGQNRLQSRLSPLIDIGLGYLPLGQSVSSLSAGESMRLKLASHLVRNLSQLIVMDEPSTGLHFADVDRLLECIDVLIANGNSVVVIEHNEQFIRHADYVIELGPGAGPSGGEIIFQGGRFEFLRQSNSPTSRCLRHPASAHRDGSKAGSKSSKNQN